MSSVTFKDALSEGAHVTVTTRTEVVRKVTRAEILAAFGPPSGVEADEISVYMDVPGGDWSGMSLYVDADNDLIVRWAVTHKDEGEVTYG